ncbi:DUF4330 domain-containing protein [Caloranaerobacter azorensis]|uniref:DUF4330 domain-containing protein n=1 Tax=Caloranaerobacter azorensis TaxID=116090 RepID=A0A6P1YGD7_9FIRM|nr:DUF4330 domain-containing protein [Caloranaerobacter azorensis]QIB26986.1 DUF4330 domain-containing protein [Caloranaerobacter azorensis]
MKLIDNKGKIFGTINIIDIAVIIILVVLIVGGINRFTRVTPQVIEESQRAIVKIEISKVRQPTVDGIKEGDILYHYDKGRVFGKIISKEVINSKEAVATSDGKIVLADIPGKYDVILSVEANAINTSNVIIIGGEHTRIGSRFKLKNRKIAVFGTVLGIDLLE